MHKNQHQFLFVDSNKEKIGEYRKINKEKSAERHKQSLARIKRKDPEKWARTNRHRQIKIKYNLTKDRSLKIRQRKSEMNGAGNVSRVEQCGTADH